jgi:small subunit ribosomal protein S15
VKFGELKIKSKLSIKVDPKIKKLLKHDKDTGSSEAQIVALTSRINQLNEHFKSHRHDQTSRRGLINIVGKRAKLLKYLRSNDNEKYLELTKALNIRK